MNEQALRDLLTSAADRTGFGLVDDAAAADAVLETRRAQRRQRAAMGAAGACVALVVVLVPVLIGDRTPSGDAAAVLGWPSRGSLADDPDAVETVRSLPWGVDDLVPLETRSVPFVGDVPGGRLALVVGEPGDARAGDTVYGQWFFGPPGADPADFVPGSAVMGLGDAESLSSLTQDGSGLVVLADPGDAVEVSPRVVVGSDGSVRREFTRAATVDGVAMAEVDSTTGDGPAATYRVLRDGVVVDRGRPYPPLGRYDVFDPPQLTPLYPSASPPVPDAVDLAISQVTVETGEDDLRLALLWAGPLGGPGAAEAVVLAATLPNGAVVVSTAWVRTAPDGTVLSGAGCGAQSHPAGTPVDALAIAVRCRTGPGPGTDSEPVLLIVVPGGVTDAVLLPGNGEPRNFVVRPGAISMSPPPPGADRLRLEGRPADPVEQAVVDSPEGRIVDREGRPAED